MGRIYSEEQKEKRRIAKRLWYQQNKKRVSEYNAEYSKQYRKENRNELNQKKIEYYKEHKEDKSLYMANYYNTQIGRASNICSSYSQMDKIGGIGECNLTKEWIVNNIFPYKCPKCGEDDWRKMGCDRIDNDKPHTTDNVIPCCGKCNKERRTKSFEEFYGCKLDELKLELSKDFKQKMQGN